MKQEEIPVAESWFPSKRIWSATRRKFLRCAAGLAAAASPSFLRADGGGIAGRRERDGREAINEKFLEQFLRQHDFVYEQPAMA